VTKRPILGLLVGLLLALDAPAVIIDSGDGTGNTTAPIDDPGFANVGARGSLSGVYLGNGWVLTAAHVGSGDITFGGVSYPAVSGSKIVLIHSGSTEADLALFRVDPAPALAPLGICTSVPSLNADVTMIGNGLNRGAAFSFSNPPNRDDGYFWGVGRTIRWGTNVVNASGFDLQLGSRVTRSFNTTFTRNAPGDECQGANGDSGGAVFVDDGSGWELCGVMLAVGTFAGQTGALEFTAVYENLNYSADLSHYQSEILDIVTPLCGNGILTSDEQCDDGNAVDGDCCSSTCQFEAPGAACDDADACSEGDSCDGGGVCLSGSPAICDDGAFCNGVEFCDSALGCQPGTPPAIDDGVGCTDDSCDEGSDLIVNTANDALCDNTLFCDGVETCDAINDCQPGTPPAIDDGVGCTDDSCDEGSDLIVNTANDALCDNTLFCDGAEICDAINDCQPGTPPAIDDGVACTDDSCDEGSDLIVNAPNDATCDDGDSCTAGSCDEISGCEFTPIQGCGVEVPLASSPLRAVVALVLLFLGVAILGRFGPKGSSP